MTLIRALIAARAAGATITRDGDRLIVRGPQAVRPYAQALIARKDEALTLVDYLTGTASALVWRTAKVADRPGRCVLCGKPALLLDPYDGKPTHKVCAEAALAPITTTSAAPAAA